MTQSMNDNETELTNHDQTIDITFENLFYTVSVPKQKEKKLVLKGVSGRFKSGELTAIMGPSGAGKSSLLNILTGFTTDGVKGVIDMGNKTSTEANKLCSYILQDDNLYPFFTVNETMMMAANLKISSRIMGRESKQNLIDNILDSLHLSFAKETKCSNLSGGQKKRLSIALELIDNPPILFLDEPTTGLDSSSSTYTIRLLHELSREGRTIVFTIHQPSATIYELFDHVYVLAEGHCVYQGAHSNTLPFLSTLGLQCPQYHSASDYLLEVSNGEYGNFTYLLAKAAMTEQWRSSNSMVYIRDEDESADDRSERIVDDVISQNTDEKRISLYTKTSDELSSKISFNNRSTMRSTPSELTRLLILVSRMYVLLFRDWTVTHLKLFLHILCGILIGLFFGDSGVNAHKSISNIGFFLANIVYLWYTTMMPGVLRFPNEINILRKEVFNNWYKLRTFYVASLITSTPIHALFATVYVTVVYFITQQPADYDKYLKVIFIYILITILADGLGVLLGTLVNPVNGTFFGAVVTCFLVLYSGFVIMFKHMKPYMVFVSNFSAIKYALEAVVVTIYERGRTDFYCPTQYFYCHYSKSEVIRKDLMMEDDSYTLCLIKLTSQLLIFKCMAYFTLKRRLKMGEAN